MIRGISFLNISNAGGDGGAEGNDIDIMNDTGVSNHLPEAEENTGFLFPSNRTMLTDGEAVRLLFGSVPQLRL